MSLHWKGEEIQARLERTVKTSIDIVMGHCVNTSKSNHPWHNVTGTAEGSIMMRPAVQEGHRFVGRWGSFDVDYFIFLETGTSRMGARPSLRPSADQNYGKLKELIRLGFHA